MLFYTVSNTKVGEREGGVRGVELSEEKRERNAKQVYLKAVELQYLASNIFMVEQ